MPIYLDADADMQQIKKGRLRSRAAQVSREETPNEGDGSARESRATVIILHLLADAVSPVDSPKGAFSRRVLFAQQVRQLGMLAAMQSTTSRLFKTHAFIMGHVPHCGDNVALAAFDFFFLDGTYPYHVQAMLAEMRHHIPLEPISKSFEEDDEAGDLNEAEEILGMVLPTDQDAALPLYPGEEALDEPASHVAA